MHRSKLPASTENTRSRPTDLPQTEKAKQYMSDAGWRRETYHLHANVVPSLSLRNHGRKSSLASVVTSSILPNTEHD